jgi:hypothetical protein
MDVLSYCPLRASAFPWQPRPGSHALTVVCKATFELQLGGSPLAKYKKNLRIPMHTGTMILGEACALRVTWCRCT